jgi:hypothetical protein
MPSDLSDFWETVCQQCQTIVWYRPDPRFPVPHCPRGHALPRGGPLA